MLPVLKSVPYDILASQSIYPKVCGFKVSRYNGFELEINKSGQGSSELAEMSLIVPGVPG